MGTLSKRLKNAKKASTAEYYDLDLDNPNDKVEHEKLRLFDELISYMARHQIARKELANAMNKSKQEITNRLNGRNLTFNFLMKAAYALGMGVEFKITKPTKLRLRALSR